MFTAVPGTGDVWGYFSRAQWLANRGYLCIQVSFRGSTGYGKAFINAGEPPARLFTLHMPWDWSFRSGTSSGRSPPSAICHSGRRRLGDHGRLGQAEVRRQLARPTQETQDFVQREMEKMFGRRGPAHLVALLPDPGIAEPGRFNWNAI